MSRSRFLTAAAVVAVALSAGLTVVSRSDRAEAAVVWNEDFNGAAGQGVDGSKWNFDTGGGGFGNQELEYYNSGTSNVFQDGQGHLVIEARRESGGHSCWYGTCQWTSGRIQTAGKFTQQYGHIEAGIQVPKGAGLWPAFWMLGGGTWPNGGEIDIMENVGRDPNTVYGTIHGPGYSGGNAVGGTRNLGQPVGNAFHAFAVDWSPNLIVWTVDGAEYFRATPASVRGNAWVFDHPFFVILNLAVGGNFPGSPDGSTPSVNRMLVDYVHVSTAGNPPTGNAFRGNESGRCIDVPAANPADGNRLQVYDCNGTGAQQWVAQTRMRSTPSCRYGPPAAPSSPASAPTPCTTASDREPARRPAAELRSCVVARSPPHRSGDRPRFVGAVRDRAPRPAGWAGRARRGRPWRVRGSRA